MALSNRKFKSILGISVLITVLFSFSFFTLLAFINEHVYLETQLREKDERIRNLENEIVNIQIQLNEKISEHVYLEDQKKKLDDEVTRLHSLLQRKESYIEEMENETTNLKTELLEKEYQIQALMNKVESLQISLKEKDTVIGESTEQLRKYVRLHTSGTKLYNGLGQEIKLFGLNFPTQSWYDGNRGGDLIYERRDFENIRSWGFNTVRVWVRWCWLMPEEGILNENMFTADANGQSKVIEGYDEVRLWGLALDKIVDWSEELGLYVIILLEPFDDWYPQPAWAFRYLEDENRSKVGSYDDEQIFTDLLTGKAEKERNRLIESWVAIADRYRDRAHVLFEIANEPSSTLLEGEVYNYYTRWSEEIIDAIRVVEEFEHIIIVPLIRGREGKGWLYIMDEATDINRSNVVWQTHWYWPNDQDYVRDLETWFEGEKRTQHETLEYRIRWQQEKIDEFGKPHFFTEFGRSEFNQGLKEWFDDVFKLFNELEISCYIVHWYTRRPYPPNVMSIVDPDGQPKSTLFDIIKSYNPLRF